MLTTSTGFHAQLKFSNGQAARHLAHQLSIFASKHTPAVAAKVGGNGVQDADGGEREQRQIRGSIAPFASLAMIWLLVGTALIALLLNPVRTDLASRRGQRNDSVRIAPEPNPATILPPATLIRSSTPTNNLTASAVPSPPVVTPSSPLEPTNAPITPAVSAASQTTFIRIIAPITIKTRTGRVTLGKGMRLPLTAVMRSSVTVHYFDGRDYEIPISATDHH